MLHAGYQQNLVFQHERFDNMKVMIHSLEQLDRVSQAIFETIERRIKKSHERLETIEKRIDQVREKVKMVQSRKKATTVYSTPNFPAQSNQTENSSLLLHCSPVPPRFHKFDIFEISKTPNPLFENPLSAESFIVVGKQDQYIQKVQSKRQESLNEKEGLGIFPFKTIRSVSGMLVFNSQENCFFNYNTRFDPLEGVDFDEEKKESDGQTRDGGKGGAEDDGTGLFPAPKSITLEANSTTFIDLQPEASVSFAPKMGDVPKMSLPTSLPDLPNINDLPWQLDAKVDQSIAPSSLMLPSVEETPSIFPQTTSTNPNMMNQPMGQQNMMGMNMNDPFAQQNMMMQQQNMMMQQQQNMMMQQGMNMNMMGQPSSMLPPPPPPPPPPPIGGAKAMKLPVSQSPDEDEQKEEGDNQDEEEKPSSGGDFLSEIRNFNKNKLKKGAAKPGAEKKAAPEPKKAPAPAANDFMSQLFNKISLRRKAIEGKTKPGEKAGRSDDESDATDDDVDKFEDEPKEKPTKKEEAKPAPEEKEPPKPVAEEKKKPADDEEDWSVNDSESEEDDF